jgi:uncharacterized protein (DUF2252 family)
LKARLIWGIDDFDEAWPLLYANDLVRPAASARLAIDSNLLSCERILAAADGEYCEKNDRVCLPVA